MTSAAEGRRVPALRTSLPAASLVLLIAFLLTVSACSRRSPPVTVPPPTSALRLALLAERIDRILAAPEIARGTWGVAVRSTDAGDTIYEMNAGRLLMPASTLKVATLAAAAERLGWEFTYSTTLLRTGRINGGVLEGDLIVVGSGDPTIDDWDGRASGQFAGWARSLREAGVDVVQGRIIGDDNIFDDNGYGSGWAWDDMMASYSAPSSGLQFNQGTAQLVISGPATTGEPPRVEVQPLSARVPLTVHLSTTAAGTAPAVTVGVANGSVDVRGSVPVGSRTVRNVAVPNPTLYFVSALKAALAANGVMVLGAAEDIDDLGVPPPRTDAIVVGEIRSQPLAETAQTMMKLSQNLFAETLLKTIGARAGGDGSIVTGRAVALETLAGWGVPREQLLITDGSGLSRYNLATAAAMTAILDHVYRDSALREPFLRTLPVAGNDGTLERRMSNSAAAGNVRAKTGSFSNARAVAGFVRTADGENLAFSILANNYGAAPGAVDAATDAILVALAEFSRR